MILADILIKSGRVAAVASAPERLKDYAVLFDLLLAVFTIKL